MDQKGCLYLCATPIGNLEDITLRALKILKNVDLIAAEDTRHTQKLLNHYEINTPLTSYFRYNKESKGKIILQRLEKGQDVALVSDAGMPGISDPGYELVKDAVSNGITVIPIPGASAFVAALAASGLDTTHFYFHGFLPGKKNEREKVLSEIKELPCTLIFYEAPHKLVKTLHSLHKILGNRKLVVARELTKKFEEFIRCSTSDAVDYFQSRKPKGEITLLVEGKKQTDSIYVNIEELADEVLARVAAGAVKKEEIKKVAKEYGVPKRELYSIVVKKEDNE